MVYEECDSGIDRGLKQPYHKRIFAEKPVENREQVRVAGQAVEGEGLGGLAMEDLARPVVVEMHIAAGGQQERGVGQPGQPPETQGKDTEIKP